MFGKKGVLVSRKLPRNTLPTSWNAFVWCFFIQWNAKADLYSRTRYIKLDKLLRNQDSTTYVSDCFLSSLKFLILDSHYDSRNSSSPSYIQHLYFALSGFQLPELLRMAMVIWWTWFVLQCWVCSRERERAFQIQALSGHNVTVC